MMRVSSSNGSAYCATVELYTNSTSGRSRVTASRIASCRAGSSSIDTDSGRPENRARSARHRLRQARV